jgi:hypothetical protein
VLGQVLAEKAGAWLWILDIENEYRLAAEQWLAGAAPGWLSGLVAETGGYGIHVYFKAGRTVRTRAVPWGEVRGERALVVLPPSRHPETGRPYRWLSAGEPAGLDPEVVPGYGGGTGRDGHEPLDVQEVLKGAPLGRRNETLFRLACKLRGAGVPEAWARRLVSEAAEHCDPPWGSAPDEEPPEKLVARVYGRYPADSPDPTAPDRSGDGPARRRPSQATELAQLVLAAATPWHSPEGDPFVTTREGLNLRLRERDREFTEWASRLFYAHFGAAPTDEAVSRARNLVAAVARFDGPALPLFVRVGSAEGRVYVDLGRPDLRAVEIGPGYWRLVERPPVKFWRPRGMLPLPEPRPGGGGELAWLAETFGLEERADVILRGVLLSWLRPAPPYFILQVFGEPGSGKSTLSRFIVSLLDPQAVPLRGEPRDEGDLMIRARRSWVVALSNVSRVPPWLADALCRLAGGEGWGKRRLYSDDEDEVFPGGRPVLLNGVVDLAGESRRSDLQDRALRLELRRPGRPRPEWDLQAEFEALRPAVLAELYAAAARALAGEKQAAAELGDLPRMADAAVWVTAGERPAERGRFVEAVFAVRRAEAQEAVEADPLAREVLAWLEEHGGGPVATTASELLKALTARVAGPDGRPPREWPPDPTRLGGRLRRLGPVLRRCGVEVEFERAAKSGARQIILRKKAEIGACSVTHTFSASPEPFSVTRGDATPPGGDAENAVMWGFSEEEIEREIFEL